MAYMYCLDMDVPSARSKAPIAPGIFLTVERENRSRFDWRDDVPVGDWFFDRRTGESVAPRRLVVVDRRTGERENRRAGGTSLPC